MKRRSQFVALCLVLALLGSAVLPPMRAAQAQKLPPDRNAHDDRTSPNNSVQDRVEPASPKQQPQDAPGLSEVGRRQVESLIQEKESRTKAQAKLDSQLIYAAKMHRGEPITDAVERLEVDVAIDEQGYTLVDIKTDVTKGVLAAIKAAGGKVISSFARDKAVRASLPIESIETIAALPEVRFIRQAAEPVLDKIDRNSKNQVSDEVIAPTAQPSAATRSVNPTSVPGLRPGFAERARNVGEKLSVALAVRATAAAAAQQNDPEPEIGSINAESDTTHQTRTARNFYGLNGKGLKIGILSDSFNSRGEYARDIATGDLPGPGNPYGYTTPVTVVQESGSSDEGRAMAQIIHDIVPGAQLFFATANGGEANFANNIRILRNTHGCDIITDDVNYTLESPLHKSEEVSRAVDDVVAAGALYFASAGNAGNLNDGTSGVWEGDFRDAGIGNTGGIVTSVAGGTWHDFDPDAGIATQNPINRTTSAARPATLFWSDPQGLSTNDYDLYLISGTLDTNGEGRVVAASTTAQTGTQDPVEAFNVPGSSTAPSGRRIAVFKKTAALVRFIHVNLNRSRFSPGVNGANALPAFATNGQSNGHDGTSDGNATAATPAQNPGPFPGTHNSTNQVETFSSDGLRRIFYKYDNTPYTPLDLTSTGGTVLQKPNLTAADGVNTTVPGFQPFFGTSAAAPTAAAISGLIKASNPSLTPAQILSALNSTAIDIEAPGIDRDSGTGIIMPYPALQSLNTPPGATVEAGTPTITVTSGCDTALNPGETGTITVPLNNLGGAAATGVNATVTSSSPGVTMTQSTSPYPDIPSGGSASNTRPFTFKLANDMACGQTLNFSITITFTGGQASPISFPITVQVAGTPSNTASTFSYSGSPVTIPDNNSTGVNIPVTVSGFSGAVSDLNFKFGGSSCNTADSATTNGVNHVFVGDLVFKLTSPSGKTVTIISQAGGAGNSGNHFCNTVLDDDTANGSIQSVTAGTNLNTGTFKPASPLSAFDGENPNGTWILNASDIGATDVGNVTAFSLDIAGFDCPTPPAAITISGRVADAQNNGISDVVLTLSGSEDMATITDANGNYFFSLATCGGTYTVTPSKDGYTFNPPNRTFVAASTPQTGDFVGTNTITPTTLTNGQVLISEFRLRGLAGAEDEFIEIYNNTDSQITVGSSDGSTGGWLLAVLTASGTSAIPLYTIPNGTKIPARGHYLIANTNGYTLDGYAKADAYYSFDIPDNTGIALFRSGTTGGTTFDAVGFTTPPPGFADTYREGGGMTPVGTTDGQYTFYRDLTSGRPKDTNNNQNDFYFVSTNAGVYGGRQSGLGAPGPENTLSPINMTGSIPGYVIDRTKGSTVAPNRVRSTTPYNDTLTPTTVGGPYPLTLSVRRRYVNATGTPVSRLRFRIVDITSFGSPAGTADLRALTSPNITVTTSDSEVCANDPSANQNTPPCDVSVKGLTLEQPPTQAMGGAFNSTLAAGTISTGSPLQHGQAINVNFLLGGRQSGSFRFFIILEALP